MQYRVLGKTDIRVPEIGFGCGNVGGAIIRGTHEQQVAAVQHALDLGIDYFDTAAQYGNGLSEQHLGEVFAELKPDIHLATKVRVAGDGTKDVNGTIRKSLEESLTRLQRDSVDVLQLHTNVFDNDDGQGIHVADVLRKGGVADTLDALQAEKLIGHRGFTGMGDTDAIHRVIDSFRFDTVQTYYNLINPTAGVAVPDGFVCQDYRQIIANATSKYMGIIIIRSLAGGAVSGPVRAELASDKPGGVMATGNDYESDLRRAKSLSFLATTNRNVAQASVRFALDNEQVSIVLVGFSDIGQIDQATAMSGAGSLNAGEMEAMERLWASDFEVA
jgi:L-galactose dehydrogenase/L-glyceraldehyde 3-phosphate reductase